MIRKYLGAAALALGVTAMSVNVAHAHGAPKPRHGGIVQTASDLSFELVAESEGALIYVEDHGRPLDPAGMTGKLTALSGKGKSEAELVATAGRLQARGIVLVKGESPTAHREAETAKAHRG